MKTILKTYESKSNCLWLKKNTIIKFHDFINYDCQHCANATIVGENDTKSYPWLREGMTDKIDGISKDGWDVRVDEYRPIQIKLRYQCRTAF